MDDPKGAGTMLVNGTNNAGDLVGVLHRRRGQHRRFHCDAAAFRGAGRIAMSIVPAGARRYVREIVRLAASMRVLEIHAESGASSSELRAKLGRL